ncbi:MAG: WD40 repeat domain-containing protein [Moorea sp. SIO3I7]|nr:WD40 repeat domain-containing protein [Moorena sp. SIO3I7]
MTIQQMFSERLIPLLTISGLTHCPLNPPNLGDFKSSSPQRGIARWGVRGAKPNKLRKSYISSTTVILTMATGIVYPVTLGRSHSQQPLLAQSWQEAQLTQLISGHRSDVNSLAISPDSQTLISSSKDKTIKFWNLRDGRLQKTIKDFTRTPSSLVISADGKRLAAATERQINIWNLETGAPPRTLKGHTGIVRSIAISPDGKILVSGSPDKTVMVWDLLTGKTLGTITEHSDWVTAVAISPDGKHLVSASGGSDRSIKIWDLSTLELRKTISKQPRFLILPLVKIARY